MGMKRVEKKDHLRVLVCLDKMAIAIALNCGLKLDDIKEMELNHTTGWLRVITEEHLLNLKVKVNLIEWD